MDKDLEQRVWPLRTILGKSAPQVGICWHPHLNPSNNSSSLILSYFKSVPTKCDHYKCLACVGVPSATVWAIFNFIWSLTKQVNAFITVCAHFTHGPTSFFPESFLSSRSSITHYHRHDEGVYALGEHLLTNCQGSHFVFVLWICQSVWMTLEQVRAENPTAGFLMEGCYTRMCFTIKNLRGKAECFPWTCNGTWS